MYKPKQFAQKVGVTVKTLHRWDASGKLPAKRTLTNNRYYTESDLSIALGLKPFEEERQVFIYCRVSSHNQKPELALQVEAMEQFCLARGIKITETIREIGGGLNFKRKKFLKLMASVMRGEVSLIVVAHRDRLCRFAFDFIEYLAKENGCEILVANQASLSPHQELVEDLLAIVHCFSCRLYGSRSYTKSVQTQLKQILDNPLQAMLQSNKLDC